MSSVAEKITHDSPKATSPESLVDTDLLTPEKTVATGKKLTALLSETLSKKYGTGSEYSARNLEQLGQENLADLLKRLPNFFSTLKRSMEAQKGNLEPSDELALQICSFGTIGAISQVYAQQAGTRAAERFCRGLSVTPNHLYRDMAAGDLEGIVPPTRLQLRNIIASVHPSDRQLEARNIETGFSAEVATMHSLREVIGGMEDSEQTERGIRFSYGEDEERAGGDLIYTVGGKTYFIDVKTRAKRRSDEYTPDFFIDPDGVMPATKKDDPYDAKVKLFISAPNKISEDYRVRDPKFKDVLRVMIDDLESAA